MVIASRRTFVYGRFVDKALHKTGKLVSRPPGSRTETAIEILREFSASEFIGKVYVLSAGNNWLQLAPIGVHNYGWYEKFREGKELLFEMEGGELWEVLQLRTESDESGSYVAVALRHYQPARTGQFGAPRSIANTPNELLHPSALTRKEKAARISAIMRRRRAFAGR